MTWTVFLERFEARFNQETKLAGASRERRSLKFETFRRKSKPETGSFKNLVSEIERLSCLDEDEEQSNYAMCSALCTSGYGMKWCFD